MKAKLVIFVVINVQIMKRIVLMLAAAVLVVSCACRNESDQSAETQTEMENTQISEPVFDIVTSHGTMRVKLYSKTPKHRDNFAYPCGGIAFCFCVCRWQNDAGGTCILTSRSGA